MDKKQVEGLIFYYENATEVNQGIREQTMDALQAMLARIEEDEAAATRKRKSPNKSGVLQLDAETFEIIAEYPNQKEALIAVNQEGKSGISDALNGRTKTHYAYGSVWVFKNEYDNFMASRNEQ